MTTLKKRLNISLTKELDSALVELASRDSVPMATKASQLLETALEIEEDTLWDTLAKKRDNKASSFVTHDEAWR